MKQALFFVLGLLLGACSTSAHPPTAPSPSHTEVAAGLVSKTVALVARDDERNVRAYCSGVWVGPSTFATANHCVKDELVLEYATRSDVYAPIDLHVLTPIVTRPAALVAFDEQHDVALVRDPNAPPHAVARLAFDSIHVGALAQKMGQGLGLWWSYSSGEIAAIRMSEDETTVWVQATTPISPGDSGSGLFDADGGLMAITQLTYRRGQNVNMFVHAQHVDALMHKVSTL